MDTYVVSVGGPSHFPWFADKPDISRLFWSKRRVEWKLHDCSYSETLAVTSVTDVKLGTRVKLPPHWSSRKCVLTSSDSSPPASQCWCAARSEVPCMGKERGRTCKT